MIMSRANGKGYRSPVSGAEHKFRAKLEKAAREIRAEASGHTCGECFHFCGSFCVRPALGEEHVEIHTPNAVACNRFEPK
jgi:hypothetical protein